MVQGDKLKTTSMFLPSVPARPTGPPAASVTSKWWGKWFLFGLVAAIAGGLTNRAKILGGASRASG